MCDIFFPLILSKHAVIYSLGTSDAGSGLYIVNIFVTLTFHRAVFLLCYSFPSSLLHSSYWCNSSQSLSLSKSCGEYLPPYRLLSLQRGHLETIVDSRSLLAGQGWFSTSVSLSVATAVEQAVVLQCVFRLLIESCNPKVVQGQAVITLTYFIYPAVHSNLLQTEFIWNQYDHAWN